MTDDDPTHSAQDDDFVAFVVRNVLAAPHPAAQHAVVATAIARLTAERDELLELLASREADIARMQQTAALNELFEDSADLVAQDGERSQ